MIAEAKNQGGLMPDVASTDLGALDHVLTAQRGVRGWLDVQDKLIRSVNAGAAVTFPT
jgi:hypothetical protein